MTLVQLVVPDAPQVGNFRTVEGRVAYAGFYKQALAQLAPASSSRDVSTRFGTVRVYEWSTPATQDEPPVVLLPGRTSGAPMWRDNLQQLIGKRRLVALDALGDAGLSLQSVPIANMDDEAAWLDDVLDDIAPEVAVHLVGHSFGGATAAAYALRHPQRVATLTLLEPVFTLGSPPVNIYFWATILILPTPQSWRDEAMRRIGGEDEDSAQESTDDPLAKMIDIGAREYSAKLPTPAVLDHTQLDRLTMPVYVGIAGKDSLAGGQAAAQTARTYLPNATVRTWPGTTHSLPLQVPKELGHELLDFWS